MRVEKERKIFEEDVSGNCWFNLICDTLNATIYLSYKELDQRMSLLNLMEDAYRLTYKHTNRPIISSHGSWIMVMVGWTYLLCGRRCCQ